MGTALVADLPCFSQHDNFRDDTLTTLVVSEMPLAPLSPKFLSDFD